MVCENEVNTCDDTSCVICECEGVVCTASSTAVCVSFSICGYAWDVFTLSSFCVLILFAAFFFLCAGLIC